MNDPETQARLLTHLLANRPDKVERKSARKMREQEEDFAAVMSAEWRTFLKAYGRTVPADTPPLPEAEANYLRLGPNYRDPAVMIEACVLLTRALLREGLVEQTREPLRRARGLLLRIAHLPKEDREHYDALVSNLGANARMAQGRLPSLRWDIDNIHDQLVVPMEEWPHMILVLCWLCFRLGDERTPMILAEQLRALVARPGGPDCEDLSHLFAETQKMMHGLKDVWARNRQQGAARTP